MRAPPHPRESAASKLWLLLPQTLDLLSDKTDSCPRAETRSSSRTGRCGSTETTCPCSSVTMTSQRCSALERCAMINVVRPRTRRSSASTIAASIAFRRPRASRRSKNYGQCLCAPNIAASCTKHPASISPVWTQTAGRIVPNHQPASSSAFNKPRPKAWYGCSTKHPCHLQPMEHRPSLRRSA